MKKKYLALSLISLVGAISMVSCNTEQASSSSEESSESSAATIAGKIVLNTKVPTEIELGKSLNLEDYVTVTKVSEWTLESESETISIEGHSIKGVDFGDFSVLIIAGTTKKAYTGTVISKDKVAFNSIVTSITDNYTSAALMIGSTASTTYDTSHGINFHNEKYFASQELDANYAPTTSFSGYVSAPDNNTYAFEFQADKDNGTNPTDFKVNPGLQRDRSNYYLGMDVSLKGTDFTEVIDADGNPTGIYEMKNRDIDDYSTLVGDFSAASTGLSTVESLVDTYNATYYVSLGEDDDGNYNGNVVFQLVGTSGGQTGLLGLAIVIYNIGETSIKPTEDWLASPVYPEAYDVTPLSNVFDKMNESKNYTVKSKGYWLNMSTGQEASAAQAKACTKSANGMFFTYDAVTYVTESQYYSRIDSLADAEAYGTDGFKVNETQGAYIKNNGFYTVMGTYADNTTTWGESTKSDEIVGSDDKTISIWDSTFGSSYFTAENLKKANWWNYSESTDATTDVTDKIYYFNEMGEDEGQLLINSMLQIGNYIGATIASNFTVKYPQYQYNYFAVGSDGSLTFTTFIPWGTVDGVTFYYLMESSFESIGSTSIPTDANMASLLA